MRVVLQRVSEAHVDIEGVCVGRIDRGFLLLVGIGQSDGSDDVSLLADKISGLRVFEDEKGKMNRAIGEAGGAVLSVSQFTLYGDVRHGRRPSFSAAARPETAKLLYEAFNRRLGDHGIRVSTGQFGADMAVSLVNDGPVTLIIESEQGMLKG
ncbi:MAG: D-aminoacyl-tRNA deacylase [Sporolactobacillus sp.]